MMRDIRDLKGTINGIFEPHREHKSEYLRKITQMYFYLNTKSTKIFSDHFPSGEFEHAHQ